MNKEVEKKYEFKILDLEGERICKGTYEECVEFKEKSLNNKYLVKKKVNSWKIIRN